MVYFLKWMSTQMKYSMMSLYVSVNYVVLSRFSKPCRTRTSVVDDSRYFTTVHICI